MTAALVSVRDAGVLDQSDRAVRRLQDDWARGESDIEAVWKAHAEDGSVSVLAALVKADLGRRFARGERPSAAEYLERFPALRDDAERVLSLVYEEFCLREELGDQPDTEEFCERYAPWKDSLASQLRYHRVISRVAGGPPAPPRYPAEGELFDEFRIGAVLGQGGAARVYLARDESLGGRVVALKVSHDRGSEPSILGRLDHAHIIAVLSLARQQETNLRGLAMPYRPGLPLDDVIRRVNPASRPGGARVLRDALAPPAGRPLADRDAAPGDVGWDSFPTRGSYSDGVAWVGQVLADALAYAHGKNIFHRDVKPANVLLTYRDGPQLLDFNLSHDPHSADQAEVALRGGTLPYMAPEQLEAFLDPARWGRVVGQADVYSLGLLLRELLTGQAPETPDAALPLPRAISALLARRAHLRADVRRLNPTVPHALEAILDRCLAFDPADRYPDADSLAEDLRRFLGRRPTKFAANPSKPERAVNWLKRCWTRLGAGAVILTACAVTAAAVRERLTPPEDRAAFLKAAASLDGDEPEAALAALVGLASEARVSPVVGIYLAAALLRTQHAKEADSQLERVWALPGAVETLAAWGKNHPGLVAQAERLGAGILNDPNLRLDPARTPDLLDRAGRTIRLAIGLRPGSVRARQALALLYEIRREYGNADAVLTGLITDTNPETSSEAKGKLRSFLITRARVSINRARSLPKPPAAGGDPKRAETIFSGAWDDLGRAERLVEPGDRNAFFDLESIRCEILLERARGTALRRDFEAALGHSRDAEHRLGRLSDHSLERNLQYRSLQKRLKAWIEAELPEFEKRAAEREK